MAEEKLGHPPTMLQICSILDDHFNLPLKHAFEAAAIMTSLMREELIFCDKIWYRWTVHKQEGYYSYSELFFAHYGPTYGCTRAGKVYPKTARTVNFSHLVQVLTSRSEEVFKENAWLWDGESRFLD